MLIRRYVIGLFSAGALLVLPTTGLAMSSPPSRATSVTSAIQAEDKIVSRNPEYKALKNFKVTSEAQIKAAIPKLKSLEVVLDNAANVVSKASATSGQSAGKADWIAGVREEATAVGVLATGLTDVIDGHTSTGEAVLKRAEKEAKAATALGEKGDKLLGLPSGD